MERQVGRKKRRSQAQGPAPSGAARPRNEDGQRQRYNAPHDPTTERELAAALAGYWHHGAPPDPAAFYVPRFARVARAFTEHRGRIRFVEVDLIELGDDLVHVYRYDGLERVLAELGDPDPAAGAFFVGILASEAPVTHAGDVARLERFAAWRRRLLDLEVERATIYEHVAAELERLP